jgi:hypothetical protein
VALSAEFEDSCTTPQIEDTENQLEAALKAAHPEISTVFVKPQTRATWESRCRSIENGQQTV